MRRKRANGEGSIFKIPDGRWKAVLTIGRAANGQPRRKSRICTSHAAARDALKELRDEISGGYVEPAKLSVGAYLKGWLTDSVQPKLAENTYHSYKFSCESYLIPLLGTIPLRTLSAMNVDGAMAAMRRDGRGQRTIENAFIVLRAALKQAVRYGMIPVSPCSLTTKPKCEAKKIRPFTAEESRTIIEGSKWSPYHALFLLALTAGMRQAELFGLQWKSVDLKAGTISVVIQNTEVWGKVVTRKPKSAAGTRIVKLTDQAVAALQDLRGLRIAVNDESLVFPAARGGSLRNNTFRKRHWVPLLKRLGIPHRGMHHCRHSCGTLMLSGGVPAHVVSKILGHSSVDVTNNIYAHALASDVQNAVSVISKLIG